MCFVWSMGGGRQDRNSPAAKTIVHPSVREQAAVTQNQSEVWESVSAGSTYESGRNRIRAGNGAHAAAAPRLSRNDLAATMREEAPTQSYAKMYGSRRVVHTVDGLVEEMQRRFRKETSGLKGERVVGVVIAYGGEVAWSDIFASGDLFDQYWNKLIHSYAVEAVARPTLREKASMEDAREFLRRLNGHEKTRVGAGGVSVERDKRRFAVAD